MINIKINDIYDKCFGFAWLGKIIANNYSCDFAEDIKHNIITIDRRND